MRELWTGGILSRPRRHAQVVWLPRNLANESTLYDLRIKLVDVYDGKILCYDSK